MPGAGKIFSSGVAGHVSSVVCGVAAGRDGVTGLSNAQRRSQPWRVKMCAPSRGRHVTGTLQHACSTRRLDLLHSLTDHHQQIPPTHALALALP